MQLFSSSMFNNLHHSHRHHNDNHHSFDNICNIFIIINEVSCLILIPTVYVITIITIKITIIVIVMIIITGRFYPSPSRMLSLLDPLLMFGILLRWPNFFGDDDDENVEDEDVYQRFLHLIMDLFSMGHP